MDGATRSYKASGQGAAGIRWMRLQWVTSPQHSAEGKGNVRALKRYAVAVLAVAALGCSGSTEPQVDSNADLISSSTEVTLKYGDNVRLDNSILRLSFGRVVEDSRCPAGVYCIWAGNAVLEIGVAVGMGPTVPLQINAVTAPRYVDWNGLRITVLQLDPLPTAGVSIRPEDYSVKLRVERIR